MSALAHALAWLTGVLGIGAFVHVTAPADPALVIRFHLLLLSSLLLVLAFAEMTVLRMLDESRARVAACAFGLLLGMLHLVLVVFYAVLLAGLQSWGDIITLDLVRGFAREVPTMLANLPFSVAPLVAAALLGGLALLALHVYLGLRRRRAWQRVLQRYRSPVWLPAVSLVLVAVPASVGSVTWLAYVEEAIFYSEPIACLLTNQTWRDATGARRSAAADERLHEQARQDYRASVPPRRPHVVLVVLDGARPDRMSAYGWERKTTPFLDSLVESGGAIAVQQAYSTCSNTACGVGSLLQSQPSNRLVKNGFGLPDALQAAGYRTMFLLSGNHSTFFALRSYYGSSPDVLMDGSGKPAAVSTDDEWVLDELRRVPLDPQQPTFLMLHLMSSHVAGRRQPEFRRWQPDAARITDALAVKAEAYSNNHDNGLLQSDANIRRVFEILESRRLLDDTIVIVTSDHGDSMGEGGRFMHSQTVYEPEIRVPLFIIDRAAVRARTSPYRSSGAVLPDIAPTLFERIGLPVPPVWRGEPLQKPSIRHWSVHQMGLYQGLIEWSAGKPGLKLVYQVREGHSQLYDLAADPREITDLAAQRRGDVARLMARLGMELGMATPGEPFTRSVADSVWK